jgi:hypothetical protein
MGALKWLQKCSRTAAGRRIILLQIFHGNGGTWSSFRHRVFMTFPAREYKPDHIALNGPEAVVNQDLETLQLRCVFGHFRKLYERRPFVA